MKKLADAFWHCRGVFRIAKVIDIGTQMSLIRRANGRFLLIDSYDLTDDDRASLLRLTDDGAAIDAIVNVHPFHTLHCRTVHELAPSARLFGTRRHHDEAPDLPWEPGFIEDPSTQEAFVADLDFSVPDGVDLVTSNDSVHAGSVLVRHRVSGIVHVDDTFSVLAGPGALGKVLPQSRLKFHPMLSKALQPRAGAADDFVGWAQHLAESWSGAPLVCAAHSAVRKLPNDGWHDEVLRALADVEHTLTRHRAEYG